MTVDGNRKKKTDKFLFHKNLTPGTLQRSIFFPFFHRCSFVCPHLNLPRATEQHTVPMKKQSPNVPRLFFFPPCPLCCLLSTVSTLLCHACVRSTAGGRWWSGWLQGEVALLSTVVLTSTETCQARSLGLGQGQKLQER